MQETPAMPMPMQSKRKMELMMTHEEAASFLSAMAKALESGSLAFGESDMDIEGFKSLSVSFKSHPGGLYAKIKCKFPKPEELCPCPECATTRGETAAPLAEGEAPAPCVRPTVKYSSLKKRMKSPWKTIREALMAGTMPNLQLVESFVADGDLMCTYPGKGDEYYNGYIKKNVAFLEAVKAGDVPAAQALAEDLEQLKKACHDRYK